MDSFPVFCLLHRRVNSTPPFHVSVAYDDTVSHLKEKIHEKTRHYLRKTDAIDLNVYRVHLTYHDTQMAPEDLLESVLLRGITLDNTMCPMSEIFEGEVPDRALIHFVAIPKTIVSSFRRTSYGKAADSEHIDRLMMEQQMMSPKSRRKHSLSPPKSFRRSSKRRQTYSYTRSYDSGSDEFELKQREKKPFDSTPINEYEARETPDNDPRSNLDGLEEENAEVTSSKESPLVENLSPKGKHSADDESNESLRVESPATSSNNPVVDSELSDSQVASSYERDAQVTDVNDASVEPGHVSEEGSTTISESEQINKESVNGALLDREMDDDEAKNSNDSVGIAEADAMGDISTADGNFSKEEEETCLSTRNETENQKKIIVQESTAEKHVSSCKNEEAEKSVESADLSETNEKKHVEEQHDGIVAGEEDVVVEEAAINTPQTEEPSVNEEKTVAKTAERVSEEGVSGTAAVEVEERMEGETTTNMEGVIETPVEHVEETPAVQISLQESRTEEEGKKKEDHDTPLEEPDVEVSSESSPKTGKHHIGQNKPEATRETESTTEVAQSIARMKVPRKAASKVKQTVSSKSTPTTLKPNAQEDQSTEEKKNSTHETSVKEHTLQEESPDSNATSATELSCSKSQSPSKDDAAPYSSYPISGKTSPPSSTSNSSSEYPITKKRSTRKEQNVMRKKLRRRSSPTLEEDSSSVSTAVDENSVKKTVKQSKSSTKSKSTEETNDKKNIKIKGKDSATQAAQPTKIPDDDSKEVKAKDEAVNQEYLKLLSNKVPEAFKELQKRIDAAAARVVKMPHQCGKPSAQKCQRCSLEMHLQAAKRGIFNAYRAPYLSVSSIW